MGCIEIYLILGLQVKEKQVTILVVGRMCSFFYFGGKNISKHNLSEVDERP